MSTSSRRLRFFAGTAVAGLALAGVAGAQTPDVRAAIEAVNKQFSAAVSRGDAAGIAACTRPPRRCSRRAATS